MGLRGRVLEIGSGDGRNFPFYPPEVTSVTGLEPSPYRRNQSIGVALNCQKISPTRFYMVGARAEDVLRRLPLTNYDGVVFSLVLCTVDDPRSVLTDVKAFLRKGAFVRVYEPRRRNLVQLVEEEFTVLRTQHFDRRSWLTGSYDLMHAVYWT